MSSIALDEEEEVYVYDQLREYVKKKPFFIVEECLDYLNYRLKLNEQFTKYKIEILVKSLIRKGLIIPGKKLARDDLLSLPKRREIFDCIEYNPGVNINDIMKKVDIGSNHVMWHLQMLKEFNYINSFKIENQKVFFTKSFNSHYYKLVFYFRKEKMKQIINFLNEFNEAKNANEISKATNIHYNTVKKYLEILSELEIIDNPKKKNHYEINRKRYIELLNTLKTK